MKKTNKLLLDFSEIKLFNLIRKVCLFSFLLLFTTVITAQTPVIPWLEGSWGARIHIRGGERLDEFVDNGYDYVAGAQEIVDNYPTMGHVITNFTNSAFPHLFLLRNNENVDAVMGAPGSIISEEFVPSLENEQIIFDVINILKAANKKVILYINCIDIGEKGSDESKAAWNSYVNKYFAGSTHKATMNLLEGYAKRFTKLGIDSYWLDAFTSYPGTPAEKSELVQMLRNTTPNAAVSVNLSKDYIVDENGAQIFVDTDGLNDSNGQDYKVIEYVGNDQWSDYTHGHITPLDLSAPPNSWAYEEFTIPAIQESAISISTNKSRFVVKHMWAPMRATWTSERTELMFTKEQAYRFVKNITEAGGMFTFASTIDDGSSPTDEEAILKYVDQKMAENDVNFPPYTRPAGAFLVGEQAKTAQSISFSAIPSKEVGDADFSPNATASSGLTVAYISSNPKVATIVNNRIHIVGNGVTRITARQNGNDRYRHAPFVTKLLTVGEGNPVVIDGDNIALNGTASQSGTQNGATANLAIDGNTNGVFVDGSVTASAGPQAWWEVDLGSEFTIDEIHVYNRTNACCIDRLSDFTVSVIDAEGNTTFSQTFTEVPNPSIVIDASGALGETVRVQSNGNTTMNLAEVEVYGDIPVVIPPNSGNLSLSGRATQTSTDYEGEASRAIDGNTNGAYSGDSVTHTAGGVAGEWWQVVLNSPTNIGDIKIFNRTDACCTSRLSNFTVLVGDGNGNWVFEQTYTNTPDPSITINALGTYGKTIRIISNTTDALSLAEVEVYEEIVYENLALSGRATQTSTDYEGEASRAIDGNTNGTYSGESVTHTTGGVAGEWWQLALKTQANIDEIKIFNRTDCCMDRLSNFTVLIGDGNGNWVFEQTFTNTPDPSISIDTRGIYGKTIRIITNTTAALSLAEVEVYGAYASAKTVIDISQGTLKIYPNPVEDLFTINLESAKTSNYTISDTTGKTIVTGVLNNGDTTINVSGLNTGLYLIQVSNESEILTGKIVKQ